MNSYELFKGYVPTKNKKSKIKFKNGAELLKLDEVKKFPEYAGVLNRNTVLIDIDNKEQSEILMKIVEDLQLNCRVYITSRGRHFLFLNNDRIKKCQTGVKLVCGLTSDIKVGSSNSIEVLKFNGEERFMEWDIEENNEYDEVPNFLLPIGKDETDLLNLKEGDGRNDVLFNYILKLNKYGFTKREIRDVFKNIINKYIFKTPLSDKELETITRDEAFPASSFSDKTGFRHDLFGQYIINQNHIVRINGECCVYKNGVYVSGLKEIESMMIYALPAIKQNQRSETLKYIDLTVNKAVTSDVRYIAFKNGILNIETMQIEDFSPDKIVTNQIPYNYDPDAYDELCDKTLNKISCFDNQVRSLLEECIGYCFYRRNEMSKSFILTGEKSNGKSTYLEMVKTLLGDTNVSSLDLGELNERFSVAEMNGKLANIGDDISDEFMQGRAIATFKKIVSGNSVKGEFKGQDVFFFNPYVKLLFSANTIPRTRDKTGAVLRRLVIIPFNAVFSVNDKDYDPFIVHKLKSENSMMYLAKLGIEGLKRVLETNSFTESESVKQALKEYDLENNPLLSFVEEIGIEAIENQKTEEVYSRYKMFCFENSFSEVSKTMFTKELNRKFHFEIKRVRINGEILKTYVKT